MKFVDCLRDECLARQGFTGNSRHNHICSHLERITKYFDELSIWRKAVSYDDGRYGAKRGLWQHGNVISYYKRAFLYAIWIEVSC